MFIISQIVLHFVCLASAIKSDDETKQKCLATNLFSLSCLISVSWLISDSCFRILISVRLLSKILFQRASSQQKSIQRKRRLMLFAFSRTCRQEKSNSRPSDSEVCRTHITRTYSWPNSPQSSKGLSISS